MPILNRSHDVTGQDAEGGMGSYPMMQWDRTSLPTPEDRETRLRNYLIAAT